MHVHVPIQDIITVIKHCIHIISTLKIKIHKSCTRDYGVKNFITEIPIFIAKFTSYIVLHTIHNSHDTPEPENDNQINQFESLLFLSEIVTTHTHTTHTHNTPT